MSHATLDELLAAFFVLAGVYSLLVIFPFIQLVRITKVGQPFFKPTTQKTFLALLLCTATFRTTFFLIVALTSSKEESFKITQFSNPLLTILDDLGCLVFFTTFTLLILFWAEITLLARNRRAVYSKRVRPLYICCVAFVYIVQFALWATILAVHKNDKDLKDIDIVDNIFYSIISLFAAFGFFFFGGNLYRMLKNNPIESTGRKNKLREVLIITVICTMCFVGRSILYIILTFKDSLSVNPFTVALYYWVSEILPAFIVLFVLRKLPPSKPNHVYPEVQAPLLN